MCRSTMVFKDGPAASSRVRQCIRKDNGHRSLLVAPALLLLATSTGSVTTCHWTVPALPPPPPTCPGLRLILHPQHPQYRYLHPSPAHLSGCTNPHLSSKGKGCFSFSLTINNEKPGLALACLNAPMLVSKDRSVELGKFNLLSGKANMGWIAPGCSQKKGDVAQLNWNLVRCFSST